MPAYPRKKIVDPDQVGIYHCIARCVRRAFLCGTDSLSGKCFEHRKGWIERRLAHLARAFAIDVCSYAVMSNHLHVILRTRPDLAAAWSAEEFGGGGLGRASIGLAAPRKDGPPPAGDC